MRIAVGGIHTESSTFNPVPTTLADFRILRGDTLLRDASFRALRELSGAELTGTLYARALPGGPVEPDTYRALRDELLQRLQGALPLDGVWLPMHGAAHVHGLEDAEADWIGAVRALVGPEPLLVASYDLHGNLSDRVAGLLDGLSAFRTAPHIDVIDTHRRALTLLVRALSTGERPSVTRVGIPLLLPGERTSTEDEPARELYARLPEYETSPGVWDASLLVGYLWADEPRAGASAAVTGTDDANSRRAAREIARGYWDARERLVFGSRHGSLDEMITSALAEAPAAGGRTLAIVADSGDNPTAGGVGDRADALAVLLAAGAGDALVAGIAAPLATARCFEAGAGAAVELEVGAQLAPGSGPVVRLTGQVERLVGAPEPLNRSAVVRSGGVTVVLGARRRPYHHRADFDAIGTPLERYRVLVVKSGYLSPELAPLADPSLLALSSGAVDQDIDSLDHRRVPRPFYPRDPDMRWSPDEEPA